ncbi:Uncharacterised protein [Escherichia coli]|uniref:Uncharacterized protein n=1 Tax=Escherichia coli TaxID=562 RepID=A0A376S729_ECOLX|nr:Uncharacterised protein [Escherichia coli]
MPVRRHCAVFELMVEEVARNASVVATEHGSREEVSQ